MQPVRKILVDEWEEEQNSNKFLCLLCSQQICLVLYSRWVLFTSCRAAKQNLGYIQVCVSQSFPKHPEHSLVVPMSSVHGFSFSNREGLQFLTCFNHAPTFCHSVPTASCILTFLMQQRFTSRTTFLKPFRSQKQKEPCQRQMHA